MNHISSKSTTGGPSSGGIASSNANQPIGLSPVTPIATTSSGTFAEMNHMLDVVGVKFDRSLYPAGESIGGVGDAHLNRLEMVRIL
jgi:hypothetical protein